MGHNKRLTFLQTLFGFRGRIGRLRFLGYNCLIGLLFIPIVFLAVEFAQDVRLAGNAYGGIAAAIMLPWLFAAWAGAALLVKRLHDLDRSGLHVLWICAAWYLPSSMLPSGVAIGVQIIAVGASLVLLLMRGTEGPNRSGPESGMTVDRRASNAPHAA